MLYFSFYNYFTQNALRCFLSVLEITSLDVDLLTNKLRYILVERTVASKNMICDGDIHKKIFMSIGRSHQRLHEGGIEKNLLFPCFAAMSSIPKKLLNF